MHEAHPRDTAWTVAAYETPVSDRMWHLTATGNTPAPMLQTLLSHLAIGDGWDTTLGSPIADSNASQATRPLTDAGWRPTADGRWLRWQTQESRVGVQFDAFAAHTPHGPLDTWTIWAGPRIGHPTWAIRASAYTPVGLLTDLAEELAHGIGTRQTRSGQARRVKQITSSPPATPPPPLSTGLWR